MSRATLWILAPIRVNVERFRTPAARGWPRMASATGDGWVITRHENQAAIEPALRAGAANWDRRE
jgi:hypothetical protein